MKHFYNGNISIGETIESVRNQFYEYSELLLLMVFRKMISADNQAI